MSSDTVIKQQVREFYNQVGWQEQSDGFYQNASYEDLRPVSREYIHKCHLRVLRHLNPRGHLLLDAGSGPIQYPEYLEYSRGYAYRVCADISFVALQEARKRIRDHGLFVVCDIANLPFKSNAFEGMVSLHTIHHLPFEEHVTAYQELYRTMNASARGVVVNGWDNPPLVRLMNRFINLFERIARLFHPKAREATDGPSNEPAADQPSSHGTFVNKENAAWLQKEVGSRMPISIWCWRSINVRFLRTFIHAHWGGRFLLKVLYWKEELLPHFLGKYGQYPLVEIRKKS